MTTGRVLRQLSMLLVAIAVFTGIVLPLMVTGIARVVLQDTEGRAIEHDGR